MIDFDQSLQFNCRYEFLINDNGGLVFKRIGTGSVDHKTALGLLKKMRYSGFICGEWIDWESYETHLPGELAVLRKYEEMTSI